jgi:4-pyridoxolactonase
MKDTKVYLLDHGTLSSDGFILFWNRGPSGPIRYPVYSVLIEHADGRFLFDTGFDFNLAAAKMKMGTPEQSPQQSLQGQLKLLGLDPTDVNVVMNSHYHFDHVGGNKFCTCATTLCHHAELKAFENPHPTIEAPGYLDSSFLEAQGDYKPRLEVISGDQEIARGLTLFETPGHTAGHYSLMVRLSHRRPMIFTGDACYAQRSLDLMAIPSTHVDPFLAYASIERLRALAEQHDAELFFSHDAMSFASYIKAPGYYS